MTHVDDNEVGPDEVYVVVVVAGVVVVVVVRVEFGDRMSKKPDFSLKQLNSITHNRQ